MFIMARIGCFRDPLRNNCRQGVAILGTESWTPCDTLHFLPSGYSSGLNLCASSSSHCKNEYCFRIPNTSLFKPRIVCLRVPTATKSREEEHRPLRIATLKSSVVGQQSGSNRCFGVWWFVLFVAMKLNKAKT